MIRYLGRRLTYFVFVFIIISAILFFLYKLVPGDPVLLLMDGNRQSMTPEQYSIMYEQTKQNFGLDQPLMVQYVKWLGNMLIGNFGTSITYKRPVVDILAAPMRNTLLLNLLNMFLVFIIAFPLGIRCAVKKGGFLDKVVQNITIVGYSLPSMVVSIVIIFVFAVRLGWFPISGMNAPGFTGTGWEFIADRVRYMVLPVVTLTVINLAGIIRYIRSAMIDALSMDCIRTARAKGLREKVVIYSHAFRNALLPLITIITYWIISVFSGSVVIESIFLYNGMGNMMISGLRQLDYSVVLAMQMLYVVLSLVGNLIMDFLYAAADPRVKLS